MKRFFCSHPTNSSASRIFWRMHRPCTCASMAMPGVAGTAMTCTPGAIIPGCCSDIPPGGGILITGMLLLRSIDRMPVPFCISRAAWSTFGGACGAGLAVTASACATGWATGMPCASSGCCAPSSAFGMLCKMVEPPLPLSSPLPRRRRALAVHWRELSERALATQSVHVRRTGPPLLVRRVRSLPARAGRTRPCGGRDVEKSTWT